ncbi:MAG: hypothetical protein HY302_14145 [Opitutae bacterium]|nr:hypothetical protein [Opitutae bacterium]
MPWNTTATFSNESIARWLSERNEAPGSARARPGRLSLGAVAWLLVAAVGVIDYASGFEISLRFLYSIPLVLLVAARGVRPAMLMAPICVAGSLLGDIAAGVSYSSLFVPFWNALFVFCSYLLVVWLVGGLLALQRDVERRVQHRTAALADEMKRRYRLEQEVIGIAEKERWAIGQDLHDGLCQHYTATALAAQSLARMLEDDAHPGARAAHQVVRMVEDGIGQTRRLAEGLLLLTVEGEGFANALRELAHASSAQFKIECDVQFTGAVEVWDTLVATHLFRIAQESVRNAVRHGKATRVNLSVARDGQRIRMTVSDNGSGLPSPDRERRGMGTRIMAHRANLIGASLETAAAPGAGTVVVCSWEAGVQK